MRCGKRIFYCSSQKKSSIIHVACTHFTIHSAYASLHRSNGSNLLSHIINKLPKHPSPRDVPVLCRPLTRSRDHGRTSCTPTRCDTVLSSVHPAVSNPAISSADTVLSSAYPPPHSPLHPAPPSDIALWPNGQRKHRCKRRALTQTYTDRHSHTHRDRRPAGLTGGRPTAPAQE